jgi:hypothetical protein
METTVRRQPVSRRTLLSGTAGMLGGAALSSAALAQNTAPPSTGGTRTSSYNPHYPDPAWLARTQEEIIEPGLEIVDPHHHLWDHPATVFSSINCLPTSAAAIKSPRPFLSSAARCTAPTARLK